MEELNAVVIQKVQVTPTLVILRVVPEGWAVPDFIPGQFAVLGLPGSAARCDLSTQEEKTPELDKIVKRAYSIASSSVEREYVEFYISLVRSGSLTPRIFNLNVGDKLWMSRKFKGLFTMDEIPADVNIIMFATGTGLAPYMSMLRTRLGRHEARKIAVLHGARNSWDLGYRSELTAYQRLFENFTYIPVIDHPDEEPVAWAGRTGFVQEVLEKGEIARVWGADPAPGDTHALLCGNPLMVENTVKLLESRGFKEHTKNAPGEIHLERFW